MSGGNMEVRPREDDKVRGCPGKRLLSLVTLPTDEDRARDPLRGAFEEDREWDCLCKLDSNLCVNAFKISNYLITSRRQSKLLSYA